MPACPLPRRTLFDESNPGPFGVLPKRTCDSSPSVHGDGDNALSSPEAHLLPFSQMENHSNLLLNLPHHPLKLAVRSIAPAQNHPLHFTKRVHFPEKDDDLATIRVYDRSAHPAALSNLANDNGDLTETEGEVAPSARFPFPSLSSVLDYEIDPTKSSPVPSNPSPSADLLLESLNLSSSSLPA
ncbi:hypothetical protein EV363DRAFT_167610 [Boletus edulis]|nr:hypothetical protein EV363DRAFT_167610 [Boletus edulis]